MDRYNKVIRKNVLTIQNAAGSPRSNLGAFLSFKISFDNFSKYLNEIKTINTSLPIRCIIYDEGIISSNYDVQLRLNFLKSI